MLSKALSGIMGRRAEAPIGRRAEAPIGRLVQDPQNVESEIGPGDLSLPSYSPSDEDKKKIKLVEERFKNASDNRRPHEGAMFSSLAYYLGNQWMKWDAGKQMLVADRDLKNRYRVYTTRNKIRPKIKKLLARALKTRPTANVAPATLSEMDMAAAAEARALLAHFDRAFDRPSQVKRQARFALTTSTCCVKLYWDPDKEADVPQMDAQGQVTGVSRAPVGDLCEDVVPIFELYLDPKAREWPEMGWLIHAKMRSLDYVQQKYPERGALVAGETASGPEGYVESVMAAVVGEYARGSEPGQSKNSVLVKEMWEKPSGRYPQGRLVTVAGGVLLRDDPWPYQKRDDFPFVPLDYEPGQSTLYGLNAVADLIAPQRDYNENIGRMVEHVATSWGKILVPRGAEIGSDAFNSARPNEVIYYQPGPGVPQHVPAPALAPQHLDMLKVSESDLNDISGVHEVSDGGVPSGVTAAAAIHLLQEADTTQMEDFIQGLESLHLKRAQWELALATQFYQEPRLIAADELIAADDAADGQAALQAQAFRALSSGGQVRVSVQPSSATAQSPAMRNQQILELIQAGFFGPPGNPEGMLLAAKMMEREDANEVFEALIAAAQRQASQQPNPAQAEALKAQAAQQQQAMQAQAAQQQQAMQAQAMQAQQQADQEHEAELEAVKVHGQMQLEAVRNAAKLQQIAASGAAKLQQIAASGQVPKVALTAQMDPTATVEAENAAGLHGDIHAATAQAQPPKPKGAFQAQPPKPKGAFAHTNEKTSKETTS